MDSKVVFFDIDRTIYDGFIPISLVRYQSNKKTIDKTCYDEIFGICGEYINGGISYIDGVKKILSIWAKGLRQVAYKKVLDETIRFLEKKKQKFFHFVEPVIQLFKDNNYDVYFITSNPQFVAEACLKKYKVKAFYSSQFEVKKQIFTGKLETTLLTEGKKAVIKELVKKHDPRDSFSFGDSEIDAGMLELITHPFCINPTKGLEKIALKENWHIVSPKEIEKIVWQMFFL